MRIILYTGKGGTGKTSVAAATAIKCAGKGKKTLLTSMGLLSELEDLLDIKMTSKIYEVSDNLWVQNPTASSYMENVWVKIQEYIQNFVKLKAIDEISAEELITLPGVERFFSFLKILDYYKEKSFDVIIIDCTSIKETLTLLSIPEIIGYWLERFFPVHEKPSNKANVITEALIGAIVPSYEMLKEIEKLYQLLGKLKSLLFDRQTTSIRIVTTPEKSAIREAQRSFTYLSLYNFNVDTIIVNKVITDNILDGCFQSFMDIQKANNRMIKESFSPLPVYYAPFEQTDVEGIDMLCSLGSRVFENEDPSEVKHVIQAQSLEKSKLTLYIPFIDAQGLNLEQKGKDIIIKVGTIKRIITMPKFFKSLEILGAKLKNDVLEISFKEQ